MSRRSAQRLVLAALAVPPLVVGVLASLVPRVFFDDFPFVTHWVSVLPPYNAHLTTDVGELQLAFGLLLAYAAWRPRDELVVPLCLAWGLSQLAHLVFHAMHLRGLGTPDAAVELASLAGVVVMALGAAALGRSEATTHRRSRGGPARPPRS